jgi:hypothetical protein
MQTKKQPRVDGGGGGRSPKPSNWAILQKFGYPLEMTNCFTQGYDGSIATKWRIEQRNLFGFSQPEVR